MHLVSSIFRGIRKTLAVLTQSLSQYLTITLVILFAMGGGIALSSVGQLSTDLIEAQAMQNAEALALSLNLARTHYSETVTQDLANNSSIQITPEYQNIDNAIPNPATFAIEMGERFSQMNDGAETRLYSEYPFPNREKTGGPKDAFEKDAIEFLKNNPTQAYYRKENQAGRAMFRYAQPVIMESSCLDCHNRLKDSPKRNWRLGEVRGVVSISQPLESLISMRKKGLERISVSFLSLVSISGLGLFLVVNRLKQINQELDVKVREKTVALKYLAVTDELTQLYNRRHFNTMLEEKWHSALRHQLPLSVVLCDVDFFKKYNDNYGHPAGDRCLTQVATLIRESTRRADDMVARYGGEEFALLLAFADDKHAVTVVQCLQSKLNEANILHEYSGIADRVTLSLGIASIVPSRGMKPEDLIERADQALYRAKHNGRNCYEVHRIVTTFNPDIAI